MLCESVGEPRPDPSLSDCVLNTAEDHVPLTSRPPAGLASSYRVHGYQTSTCVHRDCPTQSSLYPGNCPNRERPRGRAQCTRRCERQGLHCLTAHTGQGNREPRRKPPTPCWLTGSAGGVCSQPWRPPGPLGSDHPGSWWHWDAWLPVETHSLAMLPPEEEGRGRRKRSGRTKSDMSKLLTVLLFGKLNAY